MPPDKTQCSTSQEEKDSVDSQPPQQTAAAVVCEESSDEGSLFKEFSVWKSGLVFAPSTTVRKSNNGGHSGEPRTALDPVKNPGMRPNGLTSVAEEPESMPLEQHPDASKVDNANTSFSENINEGASRKVSFRAGISSNSNNEVSRLSMGSRDKHAYINPFHTAAAVRHEDEYSSSFYTRTGAIDSKYREYNVDVDPSQGDRAADIPLFSFARPHMRGFHLAWMSFFVAFFTWFSITPLLSEIARSLDLTRQEIFTSSVLAVLSSAVTRIWIGPLNDVFGARWVMCVTLIAAAIPTALAGWLLQSKTSLYLLRLFIGIAGSSFVTCQYWTLSMFSKEIAGTANALAAGWGNLGGGVAQVVMGTLLFPLAKLAYGGKCFGKCEGRDSDDEPEFDRPSDLAWRTILVFPAILCFVTAYVVVRFGDDTPKGNTFYKYQRVETQNIIHPVPPSAFVTVWENLRQGATNFNSYLLSFQYGCCFGVEIAMTQTAALYFHDEFGLSTASAAAVASIFGWMNLFARGIGGFCSDFANACWGLRGRLWCQVCLLVVEGCLVILFSITHTLGGAIAIMVFYSVCVQAAEGSTYGLVSYVDSTVTGSVAGIVGAGGNIGGACFTLIFAHNGYQESFLLMGFVVVASAIWTVFIAIPGHRGLFYGKESNEIVEHRNRAKPPTIIVIRTNAVGDHEESNNGRDGREVVGDEEKGNS